MAQCINILHRTQSNDKRGMLALRLTFMVRIVQKQKKFSDKTDTV